MLDPSVAKRNLSQIQPVQTKRQEMMDKKDKISRPGRKPINSEPKNKRTAQNRAAQRAFRERKQQRMEELEVKVKELEDEKKAASTESDFLRMQVEMLSAELSKFRGAEFNISGLKFDKPTTERKPSTDSSTSSKKSVQTNSSNNKGRYNLEFPWNNLKGNEKAGLSYSESSNSYKGESSLSPGSDILSSSESPSLNGNNNNVNASISSTTNRSKGFVGDYNFDKDFNEKSFCHELGSACGTKENPVPKNPTAVEDFSLDLTNQPSKQDLSNLDLRSSSDFMSLFNVDSPYDQNLVFNLDQSNKILDDLDFLKNPNTNTYRDTVENAQLFDGLDVSKDNLNLNSEFDPITALTSEQSAYDPFEIGLVADSQVGSTVPSLSPAGNSSSKSTTTEHSSMSKYINDGSPTDFFGNPEKEAPKKNHQAFFDSEVVPNNENELIKCSQIWDRVTSHPKYSELDIEGLCTELRTKAKCSDKGVVVKKEELDHLLDSSVSN